MWDNTTIQMLLVGIGESLYMTVFSALFGYVIGLPLGILLVISARDGIRPNAPLYKVLDVIVNVTRSIPFLLLMVILIPVTRAIVGTSLGPTAAIVSLTFSAAPFIARMVESSLMEVDKGVIEAAHSMGASDRQIILKVLLPEARPGLIAGANVQAQDRLCRTSANGNRGAYLRCMNDTASDLKALGMVSNVEQASIRSCAAKVTSL